MRGSQHSPKTLRVLPPLHSSFTERYTGAPASSPLSDINPAKLDLVVMHTAAQLGGGRVLTRAEVAAIPQEALEAAVAHALAEFPSWAKPKLPVARVSPVQRLEDANNEVALREAREAAQHRGERPAPPPAAAKAALNALPAHMRLAAANGDRQLSHLIKK